MLLPEGFQEKLVPCLACYLSVFKSRLYFVNYPKVSKRSMYLACFLSIFKSNVYLASHLCVFKDSLHCTLQYFDS